MGSSKIAENSSKTSAIIAGGLGGKQLVSVAIFLNSSNSPSHCS